MSLALSICEQTKNKWFEPYFNTKWNQFLSKFIMVWERKTQTYTAVREYSSEWRIKYEAMKEKYEGQVNILKISHAHVRDVKEELKSAKEKQRQLLMTLNSLRN